MSTIYDIACNDYFVTPSIGLQGATTYFWLSFCDPHKPEGSQFLGVILIKGYGFMDAVSRCNMLGINPGGEVQGYELPLTRVPKDEGNANRLLNKMEAEAVEFEDIEI